jgi:uncharacterized SAM-binding protein YcdF (DUF218 family)
MELAGWDSASMLRHAVSAFILPPGLFFLLIAFGLALRAVSSARHEGRPTVLAIKLSRILFALSLLLAWALSTPILARALVAYVEALAGPPLAASALQGEPKLKADAVVVLAGGIAQGSPEWPDGLVPRAGFLQRLAYAERLAHAQGLALVIAGKGPVKAINEAALALRFLTDPHALRIPPHPMYVESASVNTQEAPIALQAMMKQGELPTFKRLVLVSSASHLARARPMFEQAGFDVIAAPTAFQPKVPFTVLDALPSASQLAASAEASHALLGELWRRLPTRAKTP